MVNQTDQFDYDVLIVGAGLSGVYNLLLVRNLGFRVRVLETGSGCGGTWWWNRYPGARFDSESVSYGFSFSQELLDEWDWTERFAPQPETLKYINYFVEKFDLNRDIQYNTRIKSAHFQNDTNSWKLTDESKREYTSRFLITAVGILSTPTLPNIPGAGEGVFKGLSFHTARWPEDAVSFEGKKVGIIGTGASAIQAIPVIAETVGHLTVFQRTPNWSAPLHNEKITPEEMKEFHKKYDAIFQACRESPGCFLHVPDQRKTMEVSDEDRLGFWEHLYASPGFGKWIGNFSDIMVDRQANKMYSDFIASKIRQRVHDPVTAEKLIPKNHGFGTRRVPLETHYFETYNKPNVHLVDLTESPIVEINEKGVNTTTEQHEFDILIYATGFDAVTGALDAIDFQGKNGEKLVELWEPGPQTYLGMLVRNFPNMFMIMGPHQAFGNIPRSIEYAGAWVTELIKYCSEHGVTYVEPSQEEVQKWTEHVKEGARGLLLSEVDSWMTGVNKNVKGKQVRKIMRYCGSAVGFRQKCDEIAANNYRDLILQ